MAEDYDLATDTPVGPEELAATDRFAFYSVNDSMWKAVEFDALLDSALKGADNLSDLADPAAARANLLDTADGADATSGNGGNVEAVTITTGDGGDTSDPDADAGDGGNLVFNLGAGGNNTGEAEGAGGDAGAFIINLVPGGTNGSQVGGSGAGGRFIVNFNGTPVIDISQTQAVFGSGIIVGGHTMTGSVWSAPTDVALGGSHVLLTSPTSTNATFASISTALQSTLTAGKRYSGRFLVKASNTVAGEGIKLDFAGGTATATAFWAIARVIYGGSSVIGTDLVTALNGSLNFTTITGETLIEVIFFIDVNAGGTLRPRFAKQSTGGGGTLTVAAGSSIELVYGG